MIRSIWVLAVIAGAGQAAADEARPIAVGAALGYAFPAGGLERGSRLADVTFGAPVLAVDGAYRVSASWSVGAALSLGATIPKLCVTASECTASVGHDVVLALLGRWRAGRWGTFAPSVDAQLGYEWLATSLADGDATSTRGYRGLAGALGADLVFALSSRLALGGRAELRAGSFQRTSLSAPGIDASRSTEGTALHLWPAIELRAVASF